MSCKVFQFINVEIRKTESFNILSHYQKVNRRWNYENGFERINEVRRNKYRESFKAREHDVFKIKHSKLQSSQQERIKKTKIRKKNGLEIEFEHLKDRFKKVSFMFVQFVTDACIESLLLISDFKIMKM